MKLFNQELQITNLNGETLVDLNGHPRPQVVGEATIVGISQRKAREMAAKGLTSEQFEEKYKTSTGSSRTFYDVLDEEGYVMTCEVSSKTTDKAGRTPLAGQKWRIVVTPQLDAETGQPVRDERGVPRTNQAIVGAPVSNAIDLFGDLFATVKAGAGATAAVIQDGVVTE